MLVDIFLNTLIEYPVSPEDEIDGVAPGSVTAGIRSDVVGRGLDLVAGVGGRNG